MTVRFNNVITATLLIATATSLGCGESSAPQVALTETAAQVETAASDEPSAKQQPAPSAAFYTVDHYGESREPFADLAMTIARAQAEDKHILLQVGGDWCGWCHLMSQFIESNEAVRSVIEENYLIMKVTYTSEHPNNAFLSYFPERQGYPHLYVLDSEGKLLHSQPTAELEEGKGYNEEVYLAFLDQWKPAAGDSAVVAELRDVQREAPTATK